MMPEEEFNMENEEEMEFHYFKVHDHDNDNRLDGLELGKATAVRKTVEMN